MVMKSPLPVLDFKEVGKYSSDS